MIIRMYYNPYLCSLKLSLLDSKGGEHPLDGNAKDQIEAKFGKRFVLEDDGPALLDIVTEAYRGSRIEVDFVGTQENFENFG